MVVVPDIITETIVDVVEISKSKHKFNEFS